METENLIERVKSELNTRIDALYNQIPDAHDVLNETITIQEASDLGKFVAYDSILRFIEKIEKQ